MVWGEKNEEGKKYFPFLPKYGSPGMLCKWFILLTVNSIANTKLLNVYSVYFKSMYGPVFYAKVSAWKRTEMFSICWSDTGFNLKRKQMQFVQMRVFFKKKNWISQYTIKNEKATIWLPKFITEYTPIMYHKIWSNRTKLESTDIFNALFKVWAFTCTPTLLYVKVLWKTKHPAPLCHGPDPNQNVNDWQCKF